jgi:hypothetical protein
MQFTSIHFGKSPELVVLPCMFLKTRKEKNRQNNEVRYCKKKNAFAMDRTVNYGVVHDNLTLMRQVMY